MKERWVVHGPTWWPEIIRQLWTRGRCRFNLMLGIDCQPEVSTAYLSSTKEDTNETYSNRDNDA
jgi:hypothetical protein